jgi:hypothetical protein
MYPIAEPDASQARIKGLLKLGYPNTGAVIKACFNVLKAFSQSLVHLKLLGYFISREGIKVDPSKIEAVKSFPTPQNQHDVRSFLGLSGYYKKYVKGLF